MFADIHLLDATRLTTLSQPLSYILALPFLYLFTLPPAVCLFHPASDPLTSNKVPAPAANPLFDHHLLLGVFAGTFVLSHSTVANVVCVSLGLLHSAFLRTPSNETWVGITSAPTPTPKLKGPSSVGP